jgi:anti-anti-sigma factor
MELMLDEIDKNVAILRADGGLNADNASELVEQVGTLVDTGVRNIIVDCTDLVYVSTPGLGTLLMLHKRMAERGGDVKIAAISGMPAQVLAMTHLDRVFDIYPDVNQARLAFRPEASEP